MKWFNNRDTVQKLTLSFGLCLFLAIAVGSIALSQMARMNRSANEIAVNSLPGTVAIGETLSNVKQLRILEWRRILPMDSVGQSRVESLIALSREAVTRNLATYTISMTQREDRKNYQDLETRWKDYLEDHKTLMKLNRGGDLRKLAQFMQGRSKDDFDVIEGILTRMLAWNKANGKALAQDTRRTYAQARMLVLILLLIAAGIGIGTAYRVIQSIASPLNQMAEAVASVAGRVAVGDVTQAIEYRSQDEMGRLAESLRGMLTYHKEMAAVAEAIAAGDLTQTITPKSDKDALGQTFNRMIGNLRQLVDALTVKSEALHESEMRYRSVVDQVKDVIFTTDATGRWTFLNPAWTAITGYSVERSLGRPILHFVEAEDRPHNQALFEKMRQREKEYFRYEMRYRTREQGICWLETRIQSRIDAQGEIIGFFGTLSGITERKQAELQLQHMALHDPLTGLPNRLLFQDRLKGALARAQRQQTGVGVLFIDLDNFKIVNDSMGHEAGDLLLKTIASRFQAAARVDDTVARLGGDEFTLLLEGLRSVTEATEVAGRIVSELQKSISLGESQVFASASIGVAYSAEMIDAEDLLRDADIAMYHAKTNGKSSYVLFEPGMNAGVVERIEIETGLRLALERGEIRVHYQPLVDLQTGKISGAEALARWEHPTQGVLLPSKFIPIAEETGLIIPLGYWVLEEACRQVVTWKAAHPDFGPFTINVNLSGKQLMRDDVVERVRAIITKTGIRPEDLKLEITESVMMADVQDTVAKLTEIKDLGVKLAMDDFGTGYSSMASLNRFPLDTVKIDRTFISQSTTDDDSRSVISAMVMLSKALNLNITGEGIETEEHVTYLQGLGCQIGQGYYFDRPVTAERMEERLTDGHQIHLNDKTEADLKMIQSLLDAA
jgi:diguanylate cyclase (GGDEF)-like protein/PAS domain S-box-containing protein